MSDISNEMAAFSRDLADVLYGVAKNYIPLFLAAVEIARSPDSPIADSELLEIRKEATDMADVLASYSRTIYLMNEGLQSNPVPSQYDPRMVRPLLLDLLENAVLLAHVPSRADLTELSIFTPEEIDERLENPQVAAWLGYNLDPQAKQEYDLDAQQRYSFSNQAPMGIPEVSPGQNAYQEQPMHPAQPPAQETVQPYPQQAPQSLPENPYPQLDPTPAPAPAPAPTPDLVPPAAPQQDHTDPWSRPLAKPSTEGERFRGSPQGPPAGP